MKKQILTGLLGLAFLTGGVANADVIVLDFEGLDNLEAVDGFYNGGTSENGNSGVNYGVEFSSNTLAIIDSDAGGSGNFGGEPSADTVMFFRTGESAIMNVAAGFEVGFSFFYSAINNAGSVDVFSGIDGTGDLLASLDIPITPSDGGDPDGAFSPFFGIGVAFDGIAQSVSFAGVQDQIAFDNITFGSDEPVIVNPVSTPVTFALFGLALTGLTISRRKKTL
jgi:hypothetical protein